MAIATAISCEKKFLKFAPSAKVVGGFCSRTSRACSGRFTSGGVPNLVRPSRADLPNADRPIRPGLPNEDLPNNADLPNVDPNRPADPSKLARPSMANHRNK